jgi:RNA polymerase sigma-70 factor, ECF subfamily
MAGIGLSLSAYSYTREAAPKPVTIDPRTWLSHGPARARRRQSHHQVTDLTASAPGRTIWLLAGRERDLSKASDDAVDEVRELLRAWSEGDVVARDRLFAIVYRELSRVAAAYLRQERRGGVLEPAALVNEAYLRLVDQRTSWQSRSHFFAVAAQMMRRILVDRARARGMNKRSGQWERVTLDDMKATSLPLDVDLLDLDDALSQLAALDPRKSQVAELRFFAGLSAEETGRVLGISLTTVEREWQAARAWLFRALSPSQ